MTRVVGAPEARVLAPAKLNLGLRIVGRRPDGYHEIVSLFVPLDLVDEVRVSVEPGGSGVDFALEGVAEDVPSDDRNLAARAAAAFLAQSGAACGVRVRLRKRIPVGAGLGGGSSDAGAVLRALAARLPGRLEPLRLARLALELGADVPFFLEPRPARVSGVGEVVEPLAGFPPLHFLLATPGPPLATAAVYEAFDGSGAALTPPEEGHTIRALSELWRAPDAGSGAAVPKPSAKPSWERLLVNDLEPVACRLRPAIGPLLGAIREAGAPGAGMSGSGPTVFGVFETAADARRARERLADPVGVRIAVAAALGSPTP